MLKRTIFDLIEPHLAPARSVLPPIARFGRASGGVAAVEFALVVPLLIAVFVCMTELMRATEAYDKAVLLARTVADITAQGDTADPIASATMTDILKSSPLVLRPFDAANAKIVVSAVGVYSVLNALKPRICSSTASTNATARSPGYASDLTIPAGYQTLGMRYVLAEVTMTYTPMLGSALSRYLGGTAGYYVWPVKTAWPVRNGTLQNSSYPEVRMPNGAVCPLI